VGGREQLAVEMSADAVEVIPKTLAENAGLEFIDIIVELRAAHEKPEGQYKGVNVFTGKVEDMREEGVVEPAIVKEQAVKSAAESASMILRIDDVIAATKPKEPLGKMPSGSEGEE
jgi:chaperonin GroEL (HSP60 family)